MHDSHSMALCQWTLVISDGGVSAPFPIATCALRVGPPIVLSITVQSKGKGIEINLNINFNNQSIK